MNSNTIRLPVLFVVMLSCLPAHAIYVPSRPVFVPRPYIAPRPAPASRPSIVRPAAESAWRRDLRYQPVLTFGVPYVIPLPVSRECVPLREEACEARP